MNFLSTAATYTPLIGHVIKAYHPFQTELFSKDETLISVVHAALSLSLDVSRHATDVILATTTIVSIIAVKVFLSSYLPAYITLIGISIAARVIVEGFFTDFSSITPMQQRTVAACKRINAIHRRINAARQQVAAENPQEEAKQQLHQAVQQFREEILQLSLVTNLSPSTLQQWIDICDQLSKGA